MTFVLLGGWHHDGNNECTDGDFGATAAVLYSEFSSWNAPACHSFEFFPINVVVAPERRILEGIHMPASGKGFGRKSCEVDIHPVYGRN